MNGELTVKRTVVVGSSMLPVLHSGDVVVLAAVERSALQKGDVIVFESLLGVKTIHRVIALSPLCTQGDNRDTPDEPVPETSPVLRCTHRVRRGKNAPIVSGAQGLRQFVWHQKTRKIRALLRQWLTPLLERRWGKIAFSALTPLYFEANIVCCLGKRPVGWINQSRWHWKRFWRMVVQAPTREEILALENEQKKRVQVR